MVIKNFRDVVKGDKAYNCSDNEYCGNVLEKGHFNTLFQNYQSSLCAEDLEELGMSNEENEEILSKCVAITQDPYDTLEGYTSAILVYDYDPSSVYCKEE